MAKSLTEIHAPSLNLEGETITTGHEQFVKACMSRIEQISLAGTELQEPPTLSASEKWGIVFRLDFVIPGGSPELKNRFIFWKDTDGNISVLVAVQQRVTELGKREN